MWLLSSKTNNQPRKHELFLNQAWYTGVVVTTHPYALWDVFLPNLDCPLLWNDYFLAHPRDLEEALEMGVDWSLREGYAWAEDKEHCEEYGRMLQADPNKVSPRAKKRGLPQVTHFAGSTCYFSFHHGRDLYLLFNKKYILKSFLFVFTVHQKNTNLFAYASFFWKVT